MAAKVKPRKAINKSSKDYLISTETKQFVANLLNEHARKTLQEPFTMAYWMDINGGRLVRVFKGRSTVDVFTPTEIIKILDFFGYKLEVRILPK